RDGQVNVTLALRQPGSSIKPLTYALAVERGYKTTDKILDAPISFPQPAPAPPYTPKNYDNKFHGWVTLRQALANSYNIPAIKILNSLGVDNLALFAQRMGITTWNDPSRWGLALTLGSNEVKMTDLAVAYGAIANSGYRQSLTPILKIYNFKNQLIFSARPSPYQVVSPATAYIITNILSDNAARAPAFGYRSYLNLSPHQVAVKTGTSNGMRDNWTIGYTSDYLAAVWVGNNDYSPMSRVASGITGASPIWNKTMKLLLQKLKKPHHFPVPNDIIKTKVCYTINTPDCPQCQIIKTEVFARGAQPKNPCPKPALIKKPGI
ncbi:MAG: penicillin-binding protein, partial [bacterium]|nr:penicillin-binding protein [bacterium]